MQKKISQIIKYTFCFSFLLLIFLGSKSQVKSQEIVDKTVATVSDTFSPPELITYSDLLWQLALQPDTPLRPPSSADLNNALQTLINQRLIALEAKRLPSLAPTDAQVKEKIKDVLDQFPSNAVFENRLRTVGFDSISDENFQSIMRQRVAIEKYLDFRFRSFVVVTSDDEAQYYRNVYVPDFRKRNPGLIVPALKDVRTQVNKMLSEQKIAADIEKFLDDAKQRADIEILFEV